MLAIYQSALQIAIPLKASKNPEFLVWTPPNSLPHAQRSFVCAQIPFPLEEPL